MSPPDPHCSVLAGLTGSFVRDVPPYCGEHAPPTCLSWRVGEENGIVRLIPYGSSCMKVVRAGVALDRALRSCAHGPNFGFYLAPVYDMVTTKTTSKSSCSDLHISPSTAQVKLVP
jgi:hypothetical protein